jgi:hypothetical protein
MHTPRIVVAAMLMASPALAQGTNDPFPKPIEATAGVVRVGFTEFAAIPDLDGQPARMMLLVNEPGTRRLFVNDMRGFGRFYTLTDTSNMPPKADFMPSGEGKTHHQEKNAAQGKPAASRADLRFGQGPDGQIFVLNKRDGIIRLLVRSSLPAVSPGETNATHK